VSAIEGLSRTAALRVLIFDALVPLLAGPYLAILMFLYGSAIRVQGCDARRYGYTK
jgi:hypothetical protein